MSFRKVGPESPAKGYPATTRIQDAVLGQMFSPCSTWPNSGRITPIPIRLAIMSAHTEPATAVNDPVVAISPPLHFSNGNKKVLIIDDTQEIRMIICESLNLYGFTTLAAEDGMTGIKFAKE